MNFDLDEDEHNDHHFNFSSGYENESPMKDLSYRPTISYKYIDYNKTNYCFYSKKFGAKESKAYFFKMQQYAQLTFRDLLEKSSHKEHFKIGNRATPREIELIESVVETTINEQNMPITGHFALYIGEKFEEGKKTKAPRIFFILGKNSVIHIMFFDLYHEIMPMSDKTKKALGIPII